MKMGKAFLISLESLVYGAHLAVAQKDETKDNIDYIGRHSFKLEEHVVGRSCL